MISRYGPGASPVITPLAGLQNYFGDKAEILHAKGCHYFDQRFPLSDVLREDPDKKAQAAIDEALELAEKSDLIVAYLGDTHDTVGESKSRLSLDLPGHQTRLVRCLLYTSPSPRDRG